MSKAETAKVQDEVRQTITLDIGAPRFAKVRVIGDAGIFKAGKQYDQDSELTLELRAAQNFEAAGDVEIIGEAE